MELARLDTFRELGDMAERINRMFSRLPARKDGGNEAITVADWSPTVDVIEDEKGYLIKAEIPEVNKNGLKITVQDGILTIQGERKQEKEEKGKRYHRVERYYGSFVRSFTLPDDVDETKVTADFKDGMLYVHLPKSEKAKPKSIEVRVT